MSPDAPIYPSTKADFIAFVKNVQKVDGYNNPLAFGIATVPRHKELDPLKFFELLRLDEISYLAVNGKDEANGTAAVINTVIDHPSPFIYTPSYDRVEEMLRYFTPFAGEAGHANIEALTEALKLQKDPDAPRMPVIVMIRETTDFKNYTLAAGLWQAIAKQKEEKEKKAREEPLQA